MKKMKKFLIASMCVAAMGAIAVPVTGSILSGKAVDTLTWDEISIGAEYTRGSTITIPDRDLSINGNSYDSVIKLTYPNGVTTTVQSGDFNLAQPGQYTLSYEAQDEQYVTYKDEVTFLVADQLWSVGNAKSKIEYGTVGSSSGLLVKLAKNDTLSFNKIIDLTDFEATDTLVRAFINPAVGGTYEFDKIVFTLTDSTDPTQVLTIRGTRSTTNNQRFVAYWTSAGPGQTLGGWDANANNRTGGFSTSAPDGIRGTAVTNTSFYSENGTYSSAYVSGCTSWSVTADKCPIAIGYDKNDVKTFVNGSWVADLDNVEYYTTEPLWKGFPSNKVFLSIQAQDCAGEEANFCVTDVYGYEITAESAENNVFVEKDPPEITIDLDEKYLSYENDTYTMIPPAVVKGNYPVPVATAYDAYSGDLKVDTKVYHNYLSETNRVERPIKNNTFLVNKTGTYTIVYKATDRMGNTTEVLYWINAVRTLDDPLALEIDTADVKIDGVCGEKFAVAPHSVTGGSGDVNVTITATCGETTLDASKGYFIPEQAGEWTINYVAKDFAGIEVSQSYTVTVDWGTIPVFVNEPVLPRYIISNIEYAVPTVLAHDYSTQTKVELVADMILKDANGETTYKVGEKFKPVVTEENPVVTLTFTVGGAEYTKELPALMPLEEKANGRAAFYVDRMFVTENLALERDTSGLKMETVEAGNANWLFANPVVAENASLTVKGIQGSSNFSAMKVTLTDSVDENVAVTMVVEDQENGFAKVNFGNLDREMNKGFNLGKNEAGDDMDILTFSYSLGKFYVDQLEVVVTADDQGNAFEGFPSGRVYISMEVIDAQAGAKYFVKQFDNHIMNKATADRTPPRVAIVGEYGGMYNKNDIYHIAPALASDTLYADIAAYVSVRTPSGEIVLDVNGLPLDNVLADKTYDINLTEYGQYRVEYVAKDSFGSGSIAHTINVFDKKAPKLSVANTWSATAKLGETVVLPELYVSDDSSSIEEMNVFRFVRNPYGKAISFGQDYMVTDFGEIKYYQYSFTFNNVGEYTFINVAYDATGNQKIVEYVVTVEA